MKKTLFFSFLFLLHISFGQGGLNYDDYSQCSGAVNIFENGEFDVSFLAKKSNNKKSFEQYKSLHQFDDQNQIWVTFIPESTGELFFTAESKTPIQMVILKQEKIDVCNEISSGLAEILRLEKSANKKTIEVVENPSSEQIKSIELNSGQKIQLVFASATEKGKLNIDWKFAPLEIVEEKRVLDKRDDDFALTNSIKVVDSKTKKPLIANISLQGKPMNGLFYASELLFNALRPGELSIHCDTEGYFYVDSTIKITSTRESETVIELDRIITGQPKQLEKIEFKPGSSELMSSSIPKLQRIKDFLVLYSGLNIEIQGHVFESGKETALGRKMSEARAKMVLKFLVDNGIDKKRLSAVGFGSSKPLIAEPKFSYEEQANRRVEIMIVEQ